MHETPHVPQSEEKIAAVVVTYNRKDLLGECLDSLLRQSHPLDAVYIIDNHSTDGTYDYLLARKLIAPAEPPDSADGSVETTKESVGMAHPTNPVVHYVRLPENTGGAGGFHEGIKRAAEAGFHWLWLMDDDLETAADALAVLVQKKQALEAAQEKPFLLNSLVLAKDQADGDRLAFPLQELSPGGYPRLGVYHWRLSEVREMVQDGLYRWACPFNGTFLPASAVREIGLPNKDFYLWGDERDYLWRAARRMSLYTVVDSKVFHPPGGRERFGWKHYYLIRNTLVLNRHLNHPALRNLKLIVVSLAWGLRHSLTAQRSCGPGGGLALVWRAIRDGRAGRLGRRDDIHP